MQSVCALALARPRVVFDDHTGQFRLRSMLLQSEWSYRIRLPRRWSTTLDDLCHSSGSAESSRQPCALRLRFNVIDQDFQLAPQSMLPSPERRSGSGICLWISQKRCSSQICELDVGSRVESERIPRMQSEVTTGVGCGISSLFHSEVSLYLLHANPCRPHPCSLSGSSRNVVAAERSLPTSRCHNVLKRR